MATPRMAEQMGRVLGGRYRLVALIGSGASAHVYRADDVVLGRRVAVKVLHPALADDEGFLRRFRAEARAVAALNHPHVMAVHDWGEDDGAPYLVLEELRGGSLLSMLDRGHRLSPAQALVVGLEAARGLDYAHRRGLVHRDVKPANLLFDEEGRLRIADFGLARALAEAALTEPQGAMVGSPRYASPEQARGLTLTAKSDVYSLALVLVEAVTGRAPFATDTALGTLMGRIDRPMEVPDELGPLQPLLEEAGDPDPERRPDAATLASALDGAARELDRPAPLPLVPLDDDEATVVLDPHPTVHDAPRAPTALFDLEQVEAADRRPKRARRERRPARPARRRWWWLAALVLAAAAVTAGVFAVRYVTTPSHEVPVLQGRTLDEAGRLARARGLDVEVVERRFDETFGEGVVVDQDPATGSLKEGRAIEVVVSRGPPPVALPELAAVPQDEATRLIEEAGLKVGKVDTPFHETVPPGIVLDWSPKDEELPKGTAVNLVVSAGPQPRQIPEVKDLDFDQAAARLAEVQLRAARAEAFSDDVPEGKVIGTEPAAGQTAPRDSEVRVIVSKGPDLVAVPDVRGRSVDEATRVLEQAGLRVTSVKGSPRDPVRSTDPGAGQRVKRGTAVDLITG